MEAHSKVGTPLYMSPEVLRGSGYDWKSDIWSLGCLLYELAMLKSPFKSSGLNLYGLFQKISKGDYAPLPPQYSDELKRLAYAMISTDPIDRPDLKTACEVARTMKARTAGNRPQNIPRVEEKAAVSNVPKVDRVENVHQEEKEERKAERERGAGGKEVRIIDEPVDQGGEMADGGIRRQQHHTADERPVSRAGHAQGSGRSGGGGGGGGSGGLDAERSPGNTRMEDKRPVSRGGKSNGQIEYHHHHHHHLGSADAAANDIDAASKDGGGGLGHGYGQGHAEEKRPESRGGIGRRAAANGMEAQREVRRNISGNSASSNDGVLHHRMETIFCKLHLLSYHDKLRESKRPSIRMTQFSMENGGGSNRRRQFLDLVMLCEFLLGEIGMAGEVDYQVMKTETPNAIATKLLGAVGKAGMDWKAIGEVTPNSITGGFGKGVVDIVDWLVDKALEKRSFSSKGILRVAERQEEQEEADVVEVEEEDENEIEDDVEVEDEDDAEEGGGKYWAGASDSKFSSSQRDMVVSDVDAHEWRTELERVGPRLKSGRVASGGTWGSRIQAMAEYAEKYSGSSEAGTAGIQSKVEMVARNAQEGRDRLTRGEVMVNSVGSIDDIRKRYREVTEDFPNVKERVEEMEKARADKMNELADVTSEASEVKEKVARKGESMSDTSSMVKMKAAIQSLKKESAAMEVRLGVLLERACSRPGNLTARAMEDGDLENSDDAIIGGSVGGKIDEQLESS